MKYFNNYTLYKIVLNTEFEKYLETVNTLIKDYLKEILQNKKKDKDEKIVKKRDKEIKYFEIGEFNHQLIDILKLKIYDLFKPINQDFIFFNIHSGYVLSNENKFNINKINLSIKEDLFNIIKDLINKRITIDVSNYPILKSIIQSYKFNNVFNIDPIIKDIVCLPVSSNLSAYEEMDLEMEDVILKDNFIKTASKISTNCKYRILFKDGKLQGFCLNQVYWYFDFNDIKDKIYQSDKLKWLFLTRHLTKKNSNSEKVSKSHQKIKSEFISKFKNSSFTATISDLTDWYYLTSDKELPSELFKYFESNQIFHKISNEKFKDKAFVTNLSNKGTAIGFYNHNHTGETPNNLEYWVSLEKKDDKINVKHFPPNPNYAPRRIEVKTLKPEFSFYLIKIFFEDFIEEILKQLKANKLIKDYIRNFDFQVDNREIDFFVCLNDFKIIKIEAKKTLSKYNIDEQKRKDEKQYLEDKFKIISDYFLVGFKSDKTVRNTYHYFIGSEDINSNDLDFKIPLFNTREKFSLNCITANNFDVLCAKLSERLNEN
jgi:hypothetical protein